ncbi:MAG: sigma-54-dependent Fis family transcriptional regulator [Planctomycetes bacterium]|nr:sigma-54-dependent Fis family transcriptional regulator [Planctomycetota bacterium]
MDFKGLDLRNLLLFDPERGQITFQDRRMLIIEVAALGLLRKNVIETLGRDRARGLLFRFGYQFGARDAESLRQTRRYASPRDWWAAGPPLRALEGFAAVTPRNVVFEPESRRCEIDLVLKNSYEAANTLRYFGTSDHPVCWTMAGLASGHASTCFGERMIFIEERCEARGDSECLLVGRKAEFWGERAAPYLHYLEGESVEQIIDTMKSEIESLRSEVELRCSFNTIVGRSPAMVKVLELACDVARTEANVLLLGESGTGKELLARALHYNSRRAAGPFLAVNCAAVHDTLLESELFGHEKGAFTGAERTTPGKFERAAGGTLFLDEIGDMNLAVQSKVLRVLQEKEFERVGGTKVLRADVRVITATNRNLAEMVKARQFREDLYYRINGFPILIPPLRERPEDILPLTLHFLKRFCAELGKAVPELSPETQAVLTGHDWPGNVRELQNAIERAVILSRGEAIEPHHVAIQPAEPRAHETPKQTFTLPPEGVSIEHVERDLLIQAMKTAHQNKTAAAKRLGLSRSALRYRLKKFGLDA